MAQAYIRALERRLAESQPVRHVASVASFFLSRIDVLVDQLLAHRIRPDAPYGEGPRPEHLFGKAAVANARLAYQSFKRTFSGERWRALAERGARVQRPLWASTSAKDPLYEDVRYIEALIGPHTVTTMPDETIDAFADHGVIRENSVEAHLEEARQTLYDLGDVGVDLDRVAWQLQNEGAQKFIDPYDASMKTLAAKRQQFLGANASQQTMALGAVRSVVPAAYAALDSRRFGRRLFAHDPWLWTADAQQAEAIRQRLGWLDSLQTFRPRVKDMTAFATGIKEAGYTHVVLLGMGGSSLWPDVCRETFGSAQGWPELLVLDNTDPVAIRQVESHLDPAQTLFIVSSKSGTTIETLSLYRYFYERVSQNMRGAAGNHFVAITDPGTPLAGEAHTRGFRHCFENPEDIGGRYAALSYVGLVPMALVELDIAALLDWAQQMRVSCGPFIPAAANPGLSLGTLLGVDYLALLPYVQPMPARHETWQSLRGALRNRLKVATTLAYGPRYLHSTGQLHKGGPNTGVFIVFTADAVEDIPIPGQPYGFAVLQRAQALGDFLALSRKQRRVIRVHLGSDIDGGLERIAESLR